MQNSNVKEEARRLVEQLSESSTWDELMHQIYVRQAIEAGLAESQAGQTVPVEDVRVKPLQIDVIAVLHGAQQL